MSAELTGLYAHKELGPQLTRLSINDVGKHCDMNFSTIPNLFPLTMLTSKLTLFSSQ